MSLRKFHAKYAPGGIADNLNQKDKARKASRLREEEMFYINKRNKKISKMTPAGFDSSIFKINELPGREKTGSDKGAAIRSNALKAADPKLRDAIASRDIFAYNAALSKLRTMIGRTTGGPKLPDEMPDSMEQRRKARIRQARRPLGSREQTLMGIF